MFAIPEHFRGVFTTCKTGVNRKWTTTEYNAFITYCWRLA